MFGRILLALAEQLETGAVQHEVPRAVAGVAARLAAGERSSTPGQRRMVRHAQLEPEQLQDAAIAVRASDPPTMTTGRRQARRDHPPDDLECSPPMA